jgi:malate dehydrogenase (oxaloacetate-decarboxylating)
MSRISIIKDDDGNTFQEIDLNGKALLDCAKFNKGCAFTSEERIRFDLLGKLPQHIEGLDDQVERLYQQYLEISDNLHKHVFLNSLHDYNMILFYKLVRDHLVEMLPIIYTPTIGVAVEKFSKELRKPNGIYISYPDRENMEKIFRNNGNDEVDLIVVTDGEGVLGIGDQGIGGMKISIGKLMVYTLCAGISPYRVLPIQLDVGTNNEDLLKDPMYLGWRHRRIEGNTYDEFIDTFVTTVKKVFPTIYLHWEDFGRGNARRVLNKYRPHMCTFNDDIQGTGTTALATILSATSVAQTAFKDHKIIIYGAGTAGAGVADMICMALEEHGLSKEDAIGRLYLIDRDGLITSTQKNLPDFQEVYAKSEEEIKNWNVKNPDNINLLEVVESIKPTILVGCSAMTGAFNEKVVKTMAQHVERPIIMPLSNPTSKSEANPNDLLEWTQGKVLIATGSPYENVSYEGKDFAIAQCNNAYTFPGLGLGVIVAKASRVTDKMIIAACNALSENAPALADPAAGLLPEFTELKFISKKIAFSVAKQAMLDNVAKDMNDDELNEKITEYYWEPKYYTYVKKPT